MLFFMEAAKFTWAQAQGPLGLWLGPGPKSTYPGLNEAWRHFQPILNFLGYRGVGEGGANTNQDPASDIQWDRVGGWA